MVFRTPSSYPVDLSASFESESPFCSTESRRQARVIDKQCFVQRVDDGSIAITLFLFRAHFQDLPSQVSAVGKRLTGSLSLPSLLTIGFLNWFGPKIRQSSDLHVARGFVKAFLGILVINESVFDVQFTLSLLPYLRGKLKFKI